MLFILPHVSAWKIIMILVKTWHRKIITDYVVKGVSEEGLKIRGKFKKQMRGVEHYKIEAYNDLDSLLGWNLYYTEG